MRPGELYWSRAEDRGDEWLEYTVRERVRVATRGGALSTYQRLYEEV